MPASARPSLLYLALLAMPAADALAADDPLAGRWLVDARLRYEHVDDAAFPRDADALTLRTRIGWRSGAVLGWSLLVEAEDVRALLDDYNSTANGRTALPAVADPEGSEWNQAVLGWAGADGAALAIGRQRIVFGNQRFVGNVGWRQNEQTFDAIHASGTLGPVALRAAWLDRVHRVFGNEHPDRSFAEHDLDTHVVAATVGVAGGELTAQGFFHENEDLPATSTRTLGARYAGTGAAGAVELLYAAEFARQRGWRHALDSGTVDYRLLEAGARIDGHTLRLGLEHLGAGDGRAFQTPLATGHAFNGWADRFLVTPVDGLEDHYLRLEGPLGRLTWIAAVHRFEAARGGARYGNEVDLQLAWPVMPRTTLIAKLADYDSRGFGADHRRAWLSIDYRF